MGRKPAAYTEIRRNDIRELMLEGKSTSYIVAVMNNEYGISRKAVEKDITIIYKRLRSELDTESKELMLKHIARYEQIYSFYMDKGTEEEPNMYFNPELAMKALEKKERLLGFLNKQNETIVNNYQQNNYQQNIINDEVLNMLKSNDVDGLKNMLNEEND